MRLLIQGPPGSARSELETELAAADHTVVSEAPDAERWEGLLDACVVFGLDGVAQIQARGIHALALIAPAQVEELPPQLSDFVLLPARPGEVLARLAALEARPSPAKVVRSKMAEMAFLHGGDVIEVTNRRAVYEWVNPSYERVLGFEASEVVGKTPGAVIRSDMHPPEFFQEIEATLARGETWRGVMHSRARSGRIVPLESTIAPVLDDFGTVIHHVAIRRDIGERLRHQEALEETNRALEQARDAAVVASRTKSEFLANMSHELRTPLNAIIGYSELLLEELEDDEDTVRDLGRIRMAGKNLLELINDVLDISKIEAEKIELHPEPFQLSELLEIVQVTVEPMVKANRNRLVVERDPRLVQIEVDRTRIRQILLNLLSNAAKFTEDGRVTLSARLDEHAAEAVFDVTDTGVGIPEDALSRLFDPFEQVDSSSTRKHGGTGLGLAISKRLVEMMGGSVSVTSTLGEGSTFTVRIPTRARRDSAAPEPRAEVGRRTVLLVDDDPNVQDMVCRALEKRQLRVVVASTGEEGLRLARQTAPDAILLDVRLPGMSGWEVLSELKLSERTAEIPVVMLTVVDQEEIGHSLGAVDYLHKPVDADQLSAAVLRHVGDGPATVLVVEDDEPTRELVRRTLEGSGHTVIEAEHGARALELLEAQVPDVVVLDLMMPVMDGFEFLRRLRSHATLAELPVLIATARVLSEPERAELEVMARKILEKSAFSRDELLAQIDRHVFGALS